MSEITISQMVAKLLHAAELEGSEVGEQWASLANAEIAARYGSDEYRKAWETELKASYHQLVTEYEEVVTTETREIAFTELWWLGDY